MSQFILRGAITPSIFPLATSANSRYLVTAGGTPFPILARAYWGIIGLSPANYQAAIADLLAKGFNALEFRAPNASQQDNFAPLDGASNLPFTTKIGGGSYTGAFTEDPDFTTPNEAYWVFLDTFLAYCETQGVAVLWFPKYIGFSNTEGWRREYVANGTTKCQTYGAYVANRYKARKNIIWMLGGDLGTSTNPWANQNEIDCESAYITGLKSVSGQASTQYCAEWASQSYGGDEPNGLGSNLTIWGPYSWEATNAEWANNGYQASTTKPTICLEEPYDEEGTDGTNKNPGNAIQPCWKYVFRSVLNGANAGYCEGNGYLTHFFDDVPRGLQEPFLVRSPGRPRSVQRVVQSPRVVRPRAPRPAKHHHVGSWHDRYGQLRRRRVDRRRCASSFLRGRVVHELHGGHDQDARDDHLHVDRPDERRHELGRRAVREHRHADVQRSRQ